MWIKFLSLFQSAISYQISPPQAEFGESRMHSSWAETDQRDLHALAASVPRGRLAALRAGTSHAAKSSSRWQNRAELQTAPFLSGPFA